MPATVKMIIIPAEDPDAFESMSVSERTRESHGWETFPVRSGRLLCTFLMKATNLDLGVFGCEDRTIEGEKVVTCLLLRELMPDTIRDLGELVRNAEKTAAALIAHGGDRVKPAAVIAALTTGEWPKKGSAAEEAAAFIHHLLRSARDAEQDAMGVCWEYRGEVVV